MIQGVRVVVGVIHVLDVAIRDIASIGPNRVVSKATFTPSRAVKWFIDLLWQAGIVANGLIRASCACGVILIGGFVRVGG